MKKITAVILFCLMFSVFSASAQAAAKVVTLMYHSVTSDTARLDAYTVSPSQLENDINYFTSNGYTTMTASELADKPLSEIDGKKILLLTFDDGYDNAYTEVFPILKRTGAKATMFLIGSYIDRYGYLNRDQIYEMANSGYIEIGNHTNAIHHTPSALLRDIYFNLDTEEEVVMDIRRNGEMIKNITGKDVTSLSWPYGFYTTALDFKVKRELGYKISFSTTYGVNNFTSGSASPLNRINRDTKEPTKWLFDIANTQFD